MAKQRYISTSFWSDPFIESLDIKTRYFFLYLLTNPSTEISGIYELTIKKMIYETGLTEKEILKAMDSLSKAMKAYYIDSWVIIVNFIKHQSLNPKVKIGIDKAMAKIPDRLREKLFKDDSLCIAYDRLSHLNSNLNSNTDLNINREREQKFAPPSFQEIKDYCLSRNNNIDAENFLNFYQSKNWMIGKNKMTDWKASVRTWEKRNKQGGTDNGKRIKSKLDSTLDAAREFIEEIDCGIIDGDSSAKEPEFAKGTSSSLGATDNQGFADWQNS